MKNNLGLTDLLNLLSGGEITSSLPDIGLGMGVSPMVRRWALMGYILEHSEAKEILEFAVKQHKLNISSMKLEKLAEISRGRGRPKKGSIEKRDAFRAFTLWNIAKNLRALGITSLTNRKLISIAQWVESYFDVDKNQTAFSDYVASDSGYEQSVSRGKKLLEIDDDWQSKVCEKIDRI